MSSEDTDDDMGSTYHPDTAEEVDKSVQVPSVSKVKYNRAYEHFQKWKKSKRANSLSQKVLMDYFTEMAVRSKPSTLWVTYSMLKTTLKFNDDVDIGSYSTLNDFLKRQNVGYKPTKVPLFTDEQIEQFINEAPDEQWLDVKVICIFGVNGAHSTNKLLNIKVEHVKIYDDLILVTVPKTESAPSRSFSITGTFYSVVQKYAALRPPNTKDSRFFIHYHQGECNMQPIGKNKFYDMSRKVAKYLRLSEPETYTGLSFRRASGISGANNGGYYSNSVAEEDTEFTLDYEPGPIEASAISCTKPYVSAARNMNINSTAHTCILSCGQVKCAFEENEHSVFHAFSIMKPSDYTITEVTPAIFASEPICRWIVGYRHVTEPVFSLSAEDKFDEITTSIPNNVRVVQKYIRRNSTQLFAAYVIVYGVNCRCHKQSADEVNFSLSAVKHER